MFDQMKSLMAGMLARALGRVPTHLQNVAAAHNAAVLARYRGIQNVQTAGRTVRDAVKRLIPLRHVSRSRMNWGPNGAQAMARRERQQWNGRLGASALWVDNDGRRWHRDSHGASRGFYWDSSGEYQTLGLSGTYECGEGYSHSAKYPCSPSAHLHG